MTKLRDRLSPTKQFGYVVSDGACSVVIAAGTPDNGPLVSGNVLTRYEILAP